MKTPVNSSVTAFVEPEFDFDKELALWESQIQEDPDYSTVNLKVESFSPRDDASSDLAARDENAKVAPMSEAGTERAVGAVTGPTPTVSDCISPVITGVELDDEPEIPTPAYVEGFIFAGAVNGIVGPPKAGKTTLNFSMLLALVEGRNWLGQPTNLDGPILYITEQSKRTFKAQLDRLPDNGRQRILRAELQNGKPALVLLFPEHHHHVEKRIGETDWDRKLRLWEDVIQKYGPSILIIDTFLVYADLGDAGENDNAKLASRFNDLRRLIAIKPSLAVVLVFHSNKASSARRKKWLSLTDIRGGSAIAGGLDHVVLINRPDKHGCKSRTLYVTVETRLTDEGTFKLTLLDDGSYQKEAIDENENQPSARVNPDQKMIADALAAHPSLAELSVRKLAEAVGVPKNQAEKWKNDHRFS